MKHRSLTDYPTLGLAVLVGALELALFSSAAKAEGPPPLPPEAYAACDSKSAATPSAPFAACVTTIP
jgi:hypothetical protein